MFFLGWLAIGLCLISLALTLLILRNARKTMGLPLAYMVNLLLIHVPGAYAFIASRGAYVGLRNNADAIVSGIGITSIAALCFVVGTALAAQMAQHDYGDTRSRSVVIDPRFVSFCLLLGWFLSFGVGSLRNVPTLGAAIYFGSSIWMIAAAIGLARAAELRDFRRFMLWIGALLVYPLTVLLFSGFLSYGSAAMIVVCSLAIVRMKTALRSVLMIVVLSFLGISVFVNYFGSRDALRSTIWRGVELEQRVDLVSGTFSDFKLFSTSEPTHLRALSLRLNQNEFVGMAAERLDSGQTEYLNGSTFLDALIAPIPRIFWPDKPTFGGSGTIIRDMTGMRLAPNTSWGVGNVMEFYINFGYWSLVPGFILLGYIIGWLDSRAASALRSQDISKSLLFFLPAVALIQPNGSLVEVVGGAFAALLAAIVLRAGWQTYVRSRPVPVSRVHPSQRGAM